MDKRYKPSPPSEQMASRRRLYETIENGAGMPLHETLDLIRKTLKLTTADIARISGVSERFIRDTIAGTGNPSLKTATQLLQPFGLSIGVVVRGDKGSHPNSE